MTEFKVGDKVKRKKPSHDPKIYGEMGVVYTIKFGAGGDFKSEEGIVINCIDRYWELVEETHFPLYSEEAAVKLLTERGYEVKAPPEPLKGRGVVYEYYRQKGVYHIINKDIFDAWPNPNSVCRIVAIVDWTEGQGLNTSK